jgi:hypothetical protein
VFQKARHATAHCQCDIPTTTPLPIAIADPPLLQRPAAFAPYPLHIQQLKDKAVSTYKLRYTSSRIVGVIKAKKDESS